MPQVNEQITDAVTQANVKNLADAPAEAMAMLYQASAHSLALSLQNAVQNQQNMAAIHQAATTQAVNLLLNMDPTQAIALVKANSGNDVASQMQALLATLNSGQQGVKSAQTTPPVTP